MHFVYPNDSYDFSALYESSNTDKDEELDFSALYENSDTDKDDEPDFSALVEGAITDEDNDGTSTLELGLEPGLGLEL